MPGSTRHWIFASITPRLPCILGQHAVYMPVHNMTSSTATPEVTETPLLAPASSQPMAGTPGHSPKSRPRLHHHQGQVLSGSALSPSQLKSAPPVIPMLIMPLSGTTTILYTEERP